MRLTSLRVTSVALIHGCISLGLGCHNGGSGDAKASEQGSDCAAQADDYVRIYGRCLSVIPDRAQQIAGCERASHQSHRARFRPEFKLAIDACAAQLSCEALFNDLADLCFSPALSATAADLITAPTRDACLNEGSERCEAVLTQGSESGNSVVSRCLVRWNQCADQRADSEPYWTEDHCLTLIGLMDTYRTDAEPCLKHGCTEVAQCLEDVGAFNY